MNESWDLITIGGGSGGLAAAQRAAEYGARVVLIEQGPLGGTCVNVGCVPKKIMWNAAILAHALDDARDYGFRVERDVTHDWPALKARRDAYVRSLADAYAHDLAKRNIRVVHHTARFVGAHSVAVGADVLEAPHIIVATGASPTVPDLPGAGLGITSDGFFELPERPQRIAVAGSGYIAVELAGVLRALGSDVTFFARHDSLLRRFDELLQRSVREALEADGVQMRWRSVPEALERRARGLHLRTRDGVDHGPYDALIWAVGRTPSTAALGLEAAGLGADAGGFIPTDRFQASPVPGIYAIGDVTGREALTPVAIAAGRRLADRLFGGMADRRLEYTNIPSVIFSHPPLGSCGLSEHDARARHGDAVKVYETQFVPLYHGVMVRKPKARMKLVTVGADERVIGCHLFGPGADEMLQGFAVAIRMGVTKRDLDDTVAIHPTLAEELVTMR